MRNLFWISIGLVLAGFGCGSNDPDAPLDLEISNLVGYWGGYEIRPGIQGTVFMPRVVHVEKEYRGTQWYAEAVGYESNFVSGTAGIADGVLSLTDFQGHPPRRLELAKVSENELEFRDANADIEWTLTRQAGCAIPFTVVGELAGLRPTFLSDGTLVLAAGNDAFLRVVPRGHCTATLSNARPGKVMAGDPSGGLWSVDVELTPTNEVRIIWHHVTDLLAEFPVVETEIVVETELLNTNENYVLFDDGLGNPVVAVEQGSNWLAAWRRVDGDWVEYQMPARTIDTIWTWRDGVFTSFDVPQDPIQGRLQIPVITAEDVIWGVFTETLNGYSGRINLVRVDGDQWTSWPVGFGQAVGLRVRADGVVDIAVKESLDLANLGVIEASPDGENWLTRYRRIGEGDQANLANAGELEFGPDGAMFFGESIRLPAAERGERKAIIKVIMTLGEGVTKVEVPVLGVSCAQDCEIMMPDNEGFEVRISASSPAALAEVIPGPATTQILSDAKSVMAVLGGALREPLEVQLEATTAPMD